MSVTSEREMRQRVEAHLKATGFKTKTDEAIEKYEQEAAAQERIKRWLRDQEQRKG
jgi:hypothetical protein